MENETASDWIADLRDTTYIVQLNSKKLRSLRSGYNVVVSSEIDNFIRGKEAKLIRLFSRILYLKLCNDMDCAAENLDEFGSVDLWLNTVNVSDAAAKALQLEVKDVTNLLQYSDADIDGLCDICGVFGEDRRRFRTATRCLKAYTKRWLDDRQEPKDEFKDSDLSWISYDKCHFLRSPQLARDSQSRRSISESGVDSGASDSGFGSNVSQTSLPTATPPPSPGLFNATAASTMSQSYRPPKSPTTQLFWNTNAAKAASPPSTPSFLTNHPSSSSAIAGASAGKQLMSSVQTSTTPPLVPKRGADGVNYMTRSRSHESNLPNRIIRDRALPNAAVVEKCESDDRATRSTFALPVGSSPPVDPAVPSVAGADQVSGSADAASRSPPSSYTSPTAVESYQSLQVPKSPRGAVRMVHNINHRFSRMWKPSMSQCSSCLRPLGISGERCVDCKLKVHTLCKSTVGPTCGLTPQLTRQIYEYVIQNREDSSWPNVYAHPYGRRSDCNSLSTSMSSSGISGLNAYDMSMSSSSSCNSSAPSTPAPIGQPSPNVYVRQQNFSFPDVVKEMPDIADVTVTVTTDDSNGDLRGSQGSDHTVHNSNEGSLIGAGSEQTLSPDDIIDSVGSSDSNFSNRHEWRRDKWSMSTIRGMKSSGAWREWTIPIEEIQFQNCSLVGRGRFGEVHHAYWHQDVAVKLLNMDHVANEKQLEEFKREVSTFRNTRHENLVLFLGCCMNPPKLGIVMNWCRGRTLYNMLHMRRDRDKLELHRIFNIAVQVSQGMSYLHGKKIVHRDLRTKNIFIENNNKVVITDFGLFSMARLVRLEPMSEKKCLHVPEHWLCYLAPEIMRSLLSCNDVGELEEPFSTMTDIYAFGTVWYELLTGEFPFKNFSAHAIIWQVARGIKPALNNFQAIKEVKDILMHCWAFKASERLDFNLLLKTFEKLPRKRLARSPSQPIHMSRSAESVF